MAWTPFQITIAVTMVVTGSINTLSTKWADNSEAKGSDGVKRKFNHPFFQAVGMFLGELSCLVVFHIMRIVRQRRGRPMELGNQSFNPFIFLPPALCDMTGTSLMYIGLNLTFASSFQMLRGAVIIFTALLSVAFLGRSVKKHMWLGMLFVVIGLILVGIADIIFGQKDHSDMNAIISGDLIIIMAQVIVAIQMVYEEKFVNKHNIPALQAVGWEGFFGFFILGLLLIPFYFIQVGSLLSGNRPQDRLEDVIDAVTQMRNNPIIIVAVIGNIVSIAFFNFAGISVTKELSATTRMVLDSLRTLVIWAFALGVGWQVFKVNEFLVQAAGFVVLIMGMSVYNDLICGPALRKRGYCLHVDDDDEDDFRPLLNENPESQAVQQSPNIQESCDTTKNTEVKNQPIPT